MEASQLVYLILPLLVAVLAVLVGRKFGTLAGVAFAGVFVAAGVAWWSSKSSKYATAMTDADDRAWNSKVAVPQFDSTPPAFMGNDPVTITAPMAPTDTEPDLLFQRNRYPKDADKNVVLPYTAESQTTTCCTACRTRATRSSRSMRRPKARPTPRPPPWAPC